MTKLFTPQRVVWGTLALVLLVLLDIAVHSALRLRAGFRQMGMAVHLGQAICFGDLHQVEAVLRAGADPNAADVNDSLLLAMASPKKDALVVLLRRYGANPSRSLIAAHSVKDAWVLMKMGADPNAPVGSDGETPLAYHCTIGNAELVRFLLEHGGDPAVRDEQGQTILERVDYAAGNHPEQAAEYGQVKSLILKAFRSRSQPSSHRWQRGEPS